MAPWQLEITRAVRPGRNTLEIDVVNAWNNRLVGDVDLPSAQRQTFLAVPTVKRNAPLLPAGLQGPVTISAMHDSDFTARKETHENTTTDDDEG
jgi:hypothetical protein